MPRRLLTSRRTRLGFLAWLGVGLAAPAACSDDDAAVASNASATGSGSGGSSSTATSSSVSAPSSSGSGGALPETFTISGVVTDGEAPVEGAIVMQAGGTPELYTGPDGTYRIELTQAIPGTPTVVASKIGYRTAGVEILELPEGPVDLALRFVSGPDNALGYTFADPGVGDAMLDNSTATCGHCHTTLTAQFQTSAHARSARDPLVQDLYAGVSRAHASEASCEAAGGSWRTGLVPGSVADPVAKCYLGGGVLPDLNPGCGTLGGPACDDPGLAPADRPKAFGRCADCHAAAIDGVAGGRSLHEAVGRAYDNGNHCDACHKVRDVDLGAPPGTAGALVLQRPRDKVSEEPGADLVPVMFGPLPDVPNAFMGGSYQPRFATSDFCGACHEQRQEALLPGASLDPQRWPAGLPTHSTYSEWSDGPWNTPGTPCQFCHMPEDPDLVSTVDVTDASNASISFGFVRPPEQIRQHIFRGPLVGTPRLVDGAITLSIEVTSDGVELNATVVAENVGCGHAIPTGEPMRALLLLVDATGCGAPLAPSGGATLGDVAGSIAAGVIGESVTVAGPTLTWADAAQVASVGDVVRAVRPTGVFDDYPGVGLFADPGLTPEEKGLEIRDPVGAATVVAVAGATLTLGDDLGLVAGDRVFLGDALVGAPSDGDAARAIAGAPGVAFARVMVDPTGARGVPHYRATDIASDNRIPPGAASSSTHRFSIPPGCDAATVSATAIYRPVPVAMARMRGWDARDHVIAVGSAAVAPP